MTYKYSTQLCGQYAVWKDWVAVVEKNATAAETLSLLLSNKVHFKKGLQVNNKTIWSQGPFSSSIESHPDECRWEWPSCHRNIEVQISMFLSTLRTSIFISVSGIIHSN